MKSNPKLITGQTVAAWNAEHRASGYIPLDHVAAIRRGDGMWDIDLRQGPRRIGTIRPGQNSERWAFWPLISIKLTEEQEQDIAEAALIASGRL